jgi:hypothetical protein
MAFNLKRMMNIFGVKPSIEAIQAQTLVSAFIRGIPRPSEAFTRIRLHSQYNILGQHGALRLTSHVAPCHQ